MRIAFLDESGIDARSRYVVVAAVLVDPDTELRDIENHLRDLADMHAAPADRQGFYFHAKDVFHGSGVFRRETYSRESRQAIMEDVCNVPRLFRLHLFTGICDKQRLQKNVPISGPMDLAVKAQATASMTCVIAIERFVRETGNEVVALFCEMNEQARRLLRDSQKFLKSPRALEALVAAEGDDPGPYARFLPFQRILGGAAFVEKDESSAIQIADAVAFVTGRKLQNKSDCDTLYAAFEPGLVTKPKWF